MFYQVIQWPSSLIFHFHQAERRDAVGGLEPVSRAAFNLMYDFTFLFIDILYLVSGFCEESD